jgi:hypothetical protein
VNIIDIWETKPGNNEQGHLIGPFRSFSNETPQIQAIHSPGKSDMCLDEGITQRSEI